MFSHKLNRYSCMFIIWSLFVASMLPVYPLTTAQVKGNSRQTGAASVTRKLKQLDDFVANGQSAEAMNLVEDLLTDNPANKQVYNKAYIAYVSLGLVPNALLLLEKMIEAFPTDISAYNKAFQMYSNVGKPDKAHSIADKLMEKMPGNADASYRAFEMFSDLKDLDRAQTALQQSVSLTTDPAKLATRQQKFTELASAREMASKKKAEDDLKAAKLKAETEEKTSRIGLIERQIADGKKTDAITGINSLVSAFPTDAELRFNAHLLLAQLGQFDAAERSLNESIDLTTDPTVKNQRRLAIDELKYKREKALEEQRKQAIALQLTTIGLLVRDGKIDEGLAGLNSLLQTYPKVAEAHFGAYEVNTSIGDLVTAEDQLKQSIALATDDKTRNSWQQKFVELNYEREKRAAELLQNVDKAIEEVNYTEATKLLSGIDKIATYHQRAYIIRGNLLGIYRQYEEAVKIYNRVLKDPTLTAETKAEVDKLRGYCLEKITKTAVAHESSLHCYFCRAELPANTAFCPVCLTFQYKVSVGKAKHITETYNWQKDVLMGVDFRFYNSHAAGNTLGTIFGGIAAAGGNATTITTRDPDDIQRNFQFAYSDSVLSEVNFSSKAVVGGSSTDVVQNIGGTAVINKDSRTEAKMAAAALSDNLIYANNPKIDAAFAMIAFNQNIFRGFAPNYNFNIFWWEEPHIFALYYDKDMRVTKAVDCYYYGESNSAGHRVITSKKPFTGPNRVDPLKDQSIFSFTYNAQGQLSAIIHTYQGKEVRRVEIVYGPNGILEERGILEGKVGFTAKFVWKNNKLFSAKYEGKAVNEMELFFQ